MTDMDYFYNRRTVRQYLDKKIDRKKIIDMLDAASHAPTTGNMQLYSVIITESEEGKKKLSPAHFCQPSVVNASAVLTFCADFNRFVKWCQERNAVPGYDNFQSWLWAVEDTMIFAQQFVTIAEMQGFGTCYLGTTTYNSEIISELLNLPKRVIPITTVTIGYPKGEASKSDRLPINAIVHDESYNNYEKSDIDRYYSKKESLPENINFMSENNKETLAQVFTDIRYPRKDNELFSDKFIKYLKSNWFDF